MNQYARVAAVTGANKGIGFAIVRHLALQYPASALNTGPFLIYVLARNIARGEAALAALNSDEQLLKAKVLRAQGGPVSLAFHEFDVDDTASIDAFVATLKDMHGQIDIAVNNAAIALGPTFNSDTATRTLRTNYHGTVYATLAFLPILRPGPLSRLVNVASMMGMLDIFPPALQQRFRSASLKDATQIMREFEEAVKNGTHEKLGFPSAAYTVSKAGLIAATRAINRSEKNDKGVLLNACCPGYVDTDINNHQGTKTIDEGAETPVMLAIQDIGGKSGEMWSSDKEVVDW
ncbi:NAD(P)-binding protein [Auricularia subglabra TFB-10046 SS5]|nr:NAD(P)-binding protein [Auricularia subglabra TFB-10046 SS5]